MQRGFFNGHRIVEHMHAGQRWFTVDDFDDPRFDTCSDAAAWISEHLASLTDKAS